MDVTLERVQFKFASIIGELCSKPLILSQFAVWVDLRLSEYKLKGAISLDCSGDKPDPDWLKGIKDDIQMHHERLSASLNESVPGNQPSSRPSRLDDFTISSGQGDLEPDPGDIQNSSQGVMIKQELDPDPQEVYALELHPHHDIPGYRERKRGHSSSREDHEFSPSPFKVRKSSDISDSHKESNQSLMSIIGSEGEDILSVEEAQNNIDIAMAAHAQESIKHMGNNSSTHLRSPHPSSTASKSLFSQDAVIPSSSSFSPAAATKPAPKVVVRRPGGEKNENLDDLDLPCNSGASPSSLPGILEKLAALKKVNRQTNRNTSSAVSIFVRYLSEKFPAEDRFMQDIPPKELDTYLTQFFTIVKKRDGSDYTAESLFALRTSLERYLVSNNYPISITKSNDFFKSQAAFSARVQSLRIMAKLGFRIAHGLPP